MPWAMAPRQHLLSLDLALRLASLDFLDDSDDLRPAMQSKSARRVFALDLQLETTHSDQILVNLGQTLFALVDEEVRPILQVLVDGLRKCK